VHIVGLECSFDTFGLTFHVDENHDTAGTHLTNEADKQRQLVFIRGEEYGLAYAVRSNFIRFDTNELGFVHVLESEFHDALRQGCREQHIEPLVRVGKPTKQVANILDESEVEHAIRFVQHGDFDFVQLENTLLEVVDDAARRANEDIDTTLNYASLLFVIRTTVRQSDLEACVLTEQLGVLRDLHRKFPSWRKHESARLLFSLWVWC
jgi:hypothetical protein